MNEYIERKLFPQKLCEAAWGRKKTFESLATNRTSAVRTEYCLLQNIADLISLRGAFHVCLKYLAQLSVVQWCSIWPPNRNWVKFQILTSNSSICLWIKIATTVSIFLNTCSLSHFVSGWKPWSSWSRCNKNCDVGEQFRTRECVNKECDGSSRESRKCNEFECYGERVSFVLRSGLQISTSGNVWRTV